jgi:hypothetical protein
MPFSFADLGYWRLASVAFAFEVSHLLLVSHWPEIRGSRLGPRPESAKVFMFMESIAVCVALMAAWGKCSRLLKLPNPRKGMLLGIAASALSLFGLFFWILES